MIAMRHDNFMILLSGLIVAAVLLAGCAFQTTQPAGQVDIARYLAEAADLSAAGQYSAAIEQLDQAAILSATDTRPLVALGQIYLKQGRWGLARETFNRVLAQEADHPAALSGLAEALLGEGQAVASANVWRRVIALDKTQAEGWAGLGRAYLARRDYPAAKESFAAALARAPHPEAQWYLALLTIPTDFSAGVTQLRQMTTRTDQRDYLLTALEPFTAQSPQAEIAKMTGIALIQLEAWPLAYYALREAASQNPADPQTWAFLGHTQGLLGLPAMAAFDRAREIAPDLALALYFEGIYLRRREQYDLAVDRFLKALALDPNNYGLALEMAYTLAEKGDYLSAEAWYRALVEAEPESVVYQERLTAFYVERSYRVAEVGLAEAERLAALAPASPRAYDLLGWARFQTADFPGAEEALRQAIALEPKGIAAHYHLGRLLEALHREAEAREEFTWVIDWDRSGAYRERILAEIRRLGDSAPLGY